MASIGVSSLVRGNAVPAVHNCISHLRARPAARLNHAFAARATSYNAAEMEELSRLAAAQKNSMDEYLELKQFLLKRTQRSAGFLALYMLLAVSGRVRLL